MSSDGFDDSMVEGWLQPLGDEKPCGDDLEYDNEFLELNKAAEGKPETQFGPGEPPNWRDVREKAEALFDKTRDLRVALLWVRAVVNLNGFAAFPAGIRLIEGLQANFWEHLHPLPDPDDGDTYARANALAMLPQTDGLFGDLRHSVIFSHRAIGELRFRAVEIGLNLYPPKEDEASLTRDQLVQMLASVVTQLPDLPEQLQSAQTHLATLSELMNDRLGTSNAPDLKPLATLIKHVQGLLPTADFQDTEGVADSDEGAGPAPSTAGPRISGAVQSREDALRAIAMVCEYLERTEPSNPAQLFLRRASRLINQNFLQLVKELAPEALNDLARVMGVDPESVSSEN